MDTNLGQTTELGQAFLNQQPAVMASIQRLRATASKLGNLQTTSQQQVTTDDGNIEIDPVDAQQMYVPVYQPDQVYDDEAAGSPFITFGIGYPFGYWMDNDFDWGNGNLIYWNQGYSRPANWWHGSRGQRNNGNTSVWHRSNRSNEAAMNRGDRGWAQGAPSSGMTRQEQALSLIHISCRVEFAAHRRIDCPTFSIVSEANLASVLAHVSDAMVLMNCILPVSYTHLDVYKRQPKNDIGPEPKILRTHIEINVIGH